MSIKDFIEHKNLTPSQELSCDRFALNGYENLVRGLYDENN